MMIFRVLAGILMLVAVFAITADVTRSLAAHGLVLTPIMMHWERLAPSTLKTFEVFVTKSVHPLVWSGGIKSMLNLPAAVVLVTLGGFFGYLGRRRRRVNIYAN